ncbi:MAG: hypothetical protein ABS76_38030 [Pelagibacterium sp. SCN 64-44]|nr:MAG: hypothetical protein ABS76_38030 [Pelagibacterium sp. SCN 64-44]
MARKYELIDLKKERINSAVLAFYGRSEVQVRSSEQTRELLAKLYVVLSDPQSTPERNAANSGAQLAFMRVEKGMRQACVSFDYMTAKFGKENAARIEAELLRTGVQARTSDGKARKQVEFEHQGRRIRERRMVVDLGKLGELVG